CISEVLMEKEGEKPSIYCHLLNIIEMIDVFQKTKILPDNIKELCLSKIVLKSRLNLWHERGEKEQTIKEAYILETCNPWDMKPVKSKLEENEGQNKIIQIQQQIQTSDKITMIDKLHNIYQQI